MTSVIAKEKAKAVTPVKAKARKAPSEVSLLVDAIIRANGPVEAAKRPKKEQDAAKTELLEIVAGLFKADQEIVLRGTLGMVKFSARSEGLEVTDVRAIHRMLGDDFYDLVSVGITELKKELSAKQLKQVTKPAPGARRLSVLPTEASILPGQDVVG